MNPYSTIAIIIAFFIIAEYISWTNHKSDWMIYIYVAIIRLFVILLAVISIVCISYDHDALYEDYEYNENLLNHYDSLRILQTEMIDSMGNHLWNQHNCDLPMFDGDLLDNIHEQESKIDSIKQIK